MRLPFFVYGTLLPGQPNHHLLAHGVTYSEPATLQNGRLYDLGHYPMLVEEDGAAVHGRLIAVKPAAYTTILARLDMLEGYNPKRPSQSAYRRRRRIVQLANGGARSAWVYIGQRRYVAGAPPVLSGDWSTYISHKMAQLQDWWATIDTVAGLHELEENNNER